MLSLWLFSGSLSRVTGRDSRAQHLNNTYNNTNKCGYAFRNPLPHLLLRGTRLQLHSAELVLVLASVFPPLADLPGVLPPPETKKTTTNKQTKKLNLDTLGLYVQQKHLKPRKVSFVERVSLY